MCCNDLRALQALHACRQLDLRVPEEVAILGVNNETVRCELSNPQLSSIPVNTEYYGQMAARILTHLMNGIEPDTMELWLMNVDIALYPQAGPLQHVPKNARKLLAHKQQIKKLFGATTAKGVTLIPTAMYFKDGRVKVEIAIAEGKRSYDKRDDIKQREMDREARRGMTRKTL